MSQHVETVIVGAGQAGLALSRCLTDLGRDHLLLERGRVAERWRSERWDSFRLLSPNWQTRLPGYAYSGPDPDGFMDRGEVGDFFDGYARSFAPPVRTGVTVTAVMRDGSGWRVRTSAGEFRAANVVVATGHMDRPAVPTMSAQLPPDVLQLHSSHYRNPAQLPSGAVVVAGAGPSGQQLALELARAGRDVTIAVGRHRTLPRHYRRRDAYWWMDRMGLLERTVDTLDSPGDAERAPSAVLAGGTDDLNLHRLAAAGVRPVGRLLDVGGPGGTTIRTAGDLAERVREADAHDRRFRAMVDDFVAATGLRVPAAGPAPAAPALEDQATALDLREERVSAVIWATGYRQDWSWLHAPVLGPGGRPVQRRGVTEAGGLYFLGLRWMHRRSSSFIDGVGEDAAYVATHIAGRMSRGGRIAA